MNLSGSMRLSRDLEDLFSPVVDLFAVILKSCADYLVKKCRSHKVPKCRLLRLVATAAAFDVIKSVDPSYLTQGRIRCNVEKRYELKIAT